MNQKDILRWMTNMDETNQVYFNLGIIAGLQQTYRELYSEDVNELATEKSLKNEDKILGNIKWMKQNC